MAVTVTHSVVAALPNNPAKEVSSDAWNAGHSVSLSASDIPVDPAVLAATDVQAALTALEATSNVYVQDTDPGAVGNGKLWIDTTILGETVTTIRRRDEDNLAWVDILLPYYGPDGISITAGSGTFTLTGQNGVPFIITAGKNAGTTIAAGSDDPSENFGGEITTTAGSVLGGGTANLTGGIGGVALPGGRSAFGGGAGNGGTSEAAYFLAEGGGADGSDGRAQVYTDNSYGDAAHPFLVSDGNDHMVWDALQASQIPDLSATYDVAGAAAAAQAAAIAASDPVGSAAAITAASLGAMTQAQVLARVFCGC